MGEITLLRLGEDDDRPDFDCGDADLNEYFRKDSRIGCIELLSITYAVRKDDRVVAYFSVSNDSLKRELVGGSPFKRLLNQVPKPKRYIKVREAIRLLQSTDQTA